MTATTCDWTEPITGTPCQLEAGHEGGHESTSEAGDTPLCDFCGPTTPTWLYPATDFTEATALYETGERSDWVSKGDWLACNDCQPYIDQRRWRALARRVVDRVPGDPAHHQFTIQALVSYWETFNSHRTGPARRWDPEKEKEK